MPDSPVVFDQPWFLLLGLLAGLPVLVRLWGKRRGRHVPWWAVTLQIVAVLLAAAAMARPAVRVGRRAELQWLVLHDTSASATGQGQIGLPWPAGLKRQTYLFAGGLAQQPTTNETAATVPVAASGVDPTRTRISPALRLAAASAQRLAGVVIRTDGQFQDDDWQAAAAGLGQRGLGVVVVPMDSPVPDAAVRELAARRRADGAVELELSLLSNAHMNRTVRIVRERPGRATVLERQVQLLAGEPASLRTTDRPAAGDAAVYRAEFVAADDLPQNDAARSAVLPLERRAAVVAAPTTGGAAAAWQALGMPTVSLAPADAPSEPAGWTNYAVVVLVDPTGTLLPAAQRQALAAYVREGGGLVQVGTGPHRDLDDRDDPLNQVAALAANPFERQPLRVVVALDASGSMAEQVAEAGAARMKFDLAAEAVLSLRRHLTAADSLEVIAFSDEPRTIYDSGQGPPDLAELRRKLADVRPAGATDIMKALAHATRTGGTPQRPGLIILVSDLEPTAYAAAKGKDLFDPAKAAEMFADKHLSLAMVATAPPGTAGGEVQKLEDLARRLSAPLVRRDRLTGLAEVFAQFMQRGRGEAVQTGRFSLELLGQPFGVAGPASVVEAYVLSAPQGEGASAAEVLGRVTVTERGENAATAGGDPVLARRQVGLGRSVSLAAPLGQGRNETLSGAPWLARTLAGASQWAMRRGEDPRFSGSVERVGGALHVEVSARAEDKWMNGLDLRAAVLRASAAGGDAPAEVAMRQTAPGRYEASLAAEGAVSAAVRLEGAGTVWQGRLGRTYEPEFAAVGPHWANLRRLAELTGGRVVSSRPAEIRELTSRWSRQPYTPVWALLLGAALTAMLAEWALTRVVRTVGEPRTPPRASSESALTSSDAS